jgi:hypothetical protein
MKITTDFYQFFSTFYQNLINIKGKLTQFYQMIYIKSLTLVTKIFRIGKII